MGKRSVTDRILLYAGLGLLALLLLATALFPATVYPPYTSYSPNPDGTKAIFLLLRQEGLEAARLSAPAPGGHGLMILVEPGGFTPADWKHVLKWVAAGNTLFLADDRPDYFERLCGFDLVPGTGPEEKDRVHSANPLLKGVRSLTLTGWARLKRASVMNVGTPALALGDDRGIFLTEVSRGTGRVILLTSPDLLTNSEISRADNLILLLNVVSLYGQQGIWFNESAHGYTLARATRTAFAWPLGLTAIQLALAVFLLFYFWGKRFGRPVPLAGETDFLAGEYVSSLARIYRQGRAQRLIMDSIFRGFRDDLARRLGTPRTLATGELVAALDRRALPDANKLAGVLTRGEMLLNKPGLSESELVSAAREMAELNIKSTNRGERHG